MNGQSAKDAIELLIVHCQMFQFGFSPPPELVLNPIGDLYNMFAGLHLISTMFLVKDARKDSSPRYGCFYRILKPMGLEHLLDPIWEIMDSTVGKTTFGEYIRKSRNRLATHGDLSFDSLHPDVRAVTFDPTAVTDFQELLKELGSRVATLHQQLEDVLTEIEKRGPKSSTSESGATSG